MQKVFPRTLTWNSDKAAECLQMKPFPGHRLSAQSTSVTFVATKISPICVKHLGTIHAI